MDAALFDPRQIERRVDALKHGGAGGLVSAFAVEWHGAKKDPARSDALYLAPSFAQNELVVLRRISP